MRFPDGTQETYGADEHDRLKIRINDQEHADLSFNSSDDVELVEYSDGHYVRLKQEDGKVIEASNNHHTVKFEYGEDGRLEKDLQDGSCVDMSMTRRVTWFSSRHLTARHSSTLTTAMICCAKFAIGRARPTRLRYDASGQVSRIVFPNRVTTHVERSRTSQDISITTSSRVHPNEAVVDDHYRSYARGRVIGLKRGNIKRQYQYDAGAGRPRRATRRVPRMVRLRSVRQPNFVREQHRRLRCDESSVARWPG